MLRGLRLCIHRLFPCGIVIRSDDSGRDRTTKLQSRCQLTGPYLIWSQYHKGTQHREVTVYGYRALSTLTYTVFKTPAGLPNTTTCLEEVTLFIRHNICCIHRRMLVDEVLIFLFLTAKFVGVFASCGNNKRKKSNVITSTS